MNVCNKPFKFPLAVSIVCIKACTTSTIISRPTTNSSLSIFSLETVDPIKWQVALSLSDMSMMINEAPNTRNSANDERHVDLETFLSIVENSTWF